MVNTENYVGTAIVAALLGAVVGALGGSRIEENYEKPTHVYVGDLNDDKREDVVVGQPDGDRFVFFQQPDGTFKRWDWIQEKEDREEQEDISRRVEVLISGKGKTPE